MAIVIYDSAYGNTKQIAARIAAVFGDGTKCVPVDNFQPGDLPGDLIIVGCPINAWRPTPKITAFLNSLAQRRLAGVKAAAFDTRLKTMFSGNAAKRIAKALQNAGAELAAPPAGFYVKGKEGPLLPGETERATTWAETIKHAMEPA